MTIELEKPKKEILNMQKHQLPGKQVQFIQNNNIPVSTFKNAARLGAMVLIGQSVINIVIDVKQQKEFNPRNLLLTIGGIGLTCFL
jgi:hypothetical protein